MRFVSFYSVIVVLFIFKINEIYSIDGKIYKSEKNNLYYIDPNLNYTWFDALSKCLKRNMVLATLETKEKTLEINNLVKKAFKNYQKLWVGAIMRFVEGVQQYVWIETGKLFNYTYWSTNNPDFLYFSEFCIEINEQLKMGWNDAQCSENKGFICEYRDQKLEQKFPLNLEEIEDEVLEYKHNLETRGQLIKEIQTENDEQKSLEDLIQMENIRLQKLTEELKETKKSETKKQELMKVNIEVEMKQKQDLQMELQKMHHEVNELLQKLKENNVKQQEQNLEMITQLKNVEETALEQNPEAKEQFGNILQKKTEGEMSRHDVDINKKFRNFILTITPNFN